MKRHTHTRKPKSPNTENSQDPYHCPIDIIIDEAGRTEVHCEGIDIPYVMQILDRLIEVSHSPLKRIEKVNSTQKAPLYDVFVSHASEDKETLVNELVEELEELGIKVWYDQSQISWGDSVRAQIDAGLRNAKYALIILSPDYIRQDKYWTHGELDSVFQLESVNGKKVLPIWHKLTKEDVAAYSPLISNRLALSTSSHSIHEIALAVAHMLNSAT